MEKKIIVAVLLLMMIVGCTATIINIRAKDDSNVEVSTSANRDSVSIAPNMGNIRGNIQVNEKDSTNLKKK